VVNSNDPLVVEPGGMTRAGLLKRGLVGAGALSGAAFLAACGSGDASSGTVSAAAGAGDGATGKKRKLIWACAAFNPTFLDIEVGMVEACNMLGWDFQKVGVPVSQYSPEAVVSTARQAIQADPDVIVTAGWVKGAYAAYEEAQKKGITVVLNDSNNSPADGARLGLGFVGIDEKASGVKMGKAMMEVAQRNGKDSGTFIFGNPYPGNANVEAHGIGLREAVGDQYEVITYKEPSDPADIISGYKAQLTKVGDDLVGIQSNGLIAPLVKALQDSGKQPGEIVVGIFSDETVAALELIKQGWLTFTADHQRYALGFLPAMLAYQSVERGIAPHMYVNDADLIDQSNVDTYIKFTTMREDLATKYKIKLA
jgi:ABC-type sugar transport system substrate-binding protein